MITSAQKLLQDEYNRRLRRNNRYSLRAFARDLKTSPSRLIEIVNGTAKITPLRAKAIAAHLFTEPAKIEFFINAAAAENSRSKSEREAALQNLTKTKKLFDHFNSYAPKAKYLSDWRNMCLFELAKLSDFDGTVTWLVKQSGFQKNLVEQSLLTMKKLGLANFDSLNARITLTSTSFCSDIELSNTEVRRLHLDLLDASKEKIEQSVEKGPQLFGSTFIPVDSKKFKFIREKLIDFIKELGVEQDQEECKDTLYFFGLQFYPINQK